MMIIIDANVKTKIKQKKRTMPLCIVTPSNDKKDKQNDLAKDNKNKKKMDFKLDDEGKRV